MQQLCANRTAALPGQNPPDRSIPHQPARRIGHLDSLWLDKRPVWRRPGGQL